MKWLLLGPLLSTTAHAACLAPAQGEWKAIDALAFKAPVEAMSKLSLLTNAPAMQAPAHQSMWSVLASDATRRLGKRSLSSQNVEAARTRHHLGAGLAFACALARWRVACGVWRVACGVWRVARGVHHDNDTVTIAEHGPVLSDVGDNPEARGCVLRDRGCTRLDTDQEEGALHDAR